MRTELQKKAAMFHAVNDISMHGEIAVFGSTFMANFPFYELSKKYLMENAVYNRSVEDLTLLEAEEILDDCILELKPEKIFLALGETDLDNPSAMSVYSRILRKIQSKLPAAKIYVLPVQKDTFSKNEESRVAFNKNLRALSERLHVTFLDLPDLAPSNVLYEKIFKRLGCFFRKSPLTFTEAFSYGG